MDRSPEKLQGSVKVKEREGKSAGGKGESEQPPRVTFNAGGFTAVRRKGEGSRPLFDRDEILNHERMSDEERRRHRPSFSQSDTDTGKKRRAYDSQRTRSLHRERPRLERCCSRCGRRCPTCRRYTTCFSGDEEIYGAYHTDCLYRTRSDEILPLHHSYLYQECYPSQIGYYYFDDPSYYEVVGNLVLHPTPGYGYFAGCEY